MSGISTPEHTCLVLEAFSYMTENSTELTIFTRNKEEVSTSVTLLRLFSPLLNTVIEGIQCLADQPLFLYIPDVSKEALEHVLEILTTGVSNIASAETKQEVEETAALLQINFINLQESQPNILTEADIEDDLVFIQDHEESLSSSNAMPSFDTSDRHEEKFIEAPLPLKKRVRKECFSFKPKLDKELSVKVKTEMPEYNLPMNYEYYEFGSRDMNENCAVKQEECIKTESKPVVAEEEKLTDNKESLQPHAHSFLIPTFFEDMKPVLYTDTNSKTILETIEKRNKKNFLKYFDLIPGQTIQVKTEEYKKSEKKCFVPLTPPPEDKNEKLENSKSFLQDKSRKTKIRNEEREQVSGAGAASKAAAGPPPLSARPELQLLYKQVLHGKCGAVHSPVEECSAAPPHKLCGTRHSFYKRCNGDWLSPHKFEEMALKKISKFEEMQKQRGSEQKEPGEEAGQEVGPPVSRLPELQYLYSQQYHAKCGETHSRIALCPAARPHYHCGARHSYARECTGAWMQLTKFEQMALRWPSTAQRRERGQRGGSVRPGKRAGLEEAGPAERSPHWSKRPRLESSVAGRERECRPHSRSRDGSDYHLRRHRDRGLYRA